MPDRTGLSGDRLAVGFRDGCRRWGGNRDNPASAAGPHLTGSAGRPPPAGADVFIFPLWGKTVAKRPVGGKCGDPAPSIPGASPTNPSNFNALQISRTAPSDALKTPCILITSPSQGEGAWYRPEAAMGMKLSGAARSRGQD